MADIRHNKNKLPVDTDTEEPVRTRTKINLTVMFLFFGIVAGFYFVYQPLWRNITVLSWEKVPAVILESELVKPPEIQSIKEIYKIITNQPWYVIATYEYKYQGESYQNDRVSWGYFSDAGLDPHHARAKQLSNYRRLNESFRCYVNPKHPEQAILYPDQNWFIWTGMLILTTAFNLLGTFTLIWIFKPDLSLNPEKWIKEEDQE